MCKFWRKEKCNHHFPELTAKKGPWDLLRSLLTTRLIGAIVVVLVVVAGAAYLIQTNITATEGYKIKDLEKKVAQLQTENAKLNLTYAQLQSMDNLIKKSATLKLVPVGKVEIVNAPETVVALK
ncbi:MAG: hypothetical protein WC516_01715 [Patescibacteria group bacterium]